MPDFMLEETARAQHRGLVAGLDEAGRGPWAGPVVAAAVILDARLALDGLDDSKRVAEDAREALFAEIAAKAIIGVGVVGVPTIDRLNILHATMRAMQIAFAKLPKAAQCALIDGNRAPELPCPAQTVVGGDARSASIAAASIVAKVTRDRLMRDLHAAFPAYGWARNKGYGTREHAAALSQHGVTAHHRRCFAPIARQLEADRMR